MVGHVNDRTGSLCLFNDVEGGTLLDIPTRVDMEIKESYHRFLYLRMSKSMAFAL